MSTIQVNKCKLDNATNDPRVFTIECSPFNLKTAAICLLYAIDRESIDKNVFILNIKGASILTFFQIFEKVCQKVGYRDEQVFYKVFSIQAEDGIIVFNSNVSSKLFALGKPIPG